MQIHSVDRCLQTSRPKGFRLHKLIKDIKTEGDVISALGEATYVVDPGTTCADPDKDGKPGKIHTFKTLRYEALSETAVVEANIDRDGKAEISFTGNTLESRPDLTNRWS